MKKEDKQVEKRAKSDHKEIKELEEKIRQLKNGWQRTQADFENYQKKMESMREEWISGANLDLIMKILPILDNFRRAALHVPENLQNSEWVKGVQMIEKHLEDILTQEGLTKIETKAGEQFDPNFHEAISHEENKEFKSEQIIAIAETGYKLGDKVIKPSKVRVAK